MRLVDLMPRWVHPNIFAFLCPHCQSVFLTCKNVPMPTWEQREAVQRELMGWDGDQAHAPEYPIDVVLCKVPMAWNFPIGAPFESMTVTPSLDASASGHWHGFITGGMITP